MGLRLGMTERLTPLKITFVFINSRKINKKSSYILSPKYPPKIDTGYVSLLLYKFLPNVFPFLHTVLFLYEAYISLIIKLDR